MCQYIHTGSVLQALETVRCRREVHLGDVEIGDAMDGERVACAERLNGRAFTPGDNHAAGSRDFSARGEKGAAGIGSFQPVHMGGHMLVGFLGGFLVGEGDDEHVLGLRIIAA